MKAMILAAGLGTRLRPLTLERAKPAIPLVGKPLVVRLIEKLMDNGVTSFRLNLHHLPGTVERIFESHSPAALPVSFSYEEHILGTAGGLKANEAFFEDKTFLMANGDVLMDLPLGPALAFHRDQGALATLLLYPQKAPYRYLPVQIDEEGNLHRFKNGPVAQGALRPEIYVFTGVHILEPEVFDFIPSGFFFQINDQVYPAALRSGKRVLAFPVEGYWNDIGDPARYLIAQREFFLRSSRDPFLCISPEASVETGSVVGPYVSAEAGCVVETDSLVANAIFWEGVRLKRGSAVRNCIAGSGMTIEGQYANCIVTRNGEARLDLD